MKITFRQGLTLCLLGAIVGAVVTSSIASSKPEPKVVTAAPRVDKDFTHVDTTKTTCEYVSDLIYGFRQTAYCFVRDSVYLKLTSKHGTWYYQHDSTYYIPRQVYDTITKKPQLDKDGNALITYVPIIRWMIKKDYHTTDDSLVQQFIKK